jgi:hypothetical protein
MKIDKRDIKPDKGKLRSIMSLSPSMYFIITREVMVRVQQD